MALRLVFAWILGALFMLSGSCLVAAAAAGAWQSTVSYYLSLAGSFILLLLAGLCWIAVAVSAKKR